MDKKGQLLSENSLICDLAFPNAASVIMSCLVTDQMNDDLLIEAMETLGFVELAATPKPLDSNAKQKMVQHMLSSNQISLKNIFQVTIDTFRPTIKAMLLTTVRQMTIMFVQQSLQGVQTNQFVQQPQDTGLTNAITLLTKRLELESNSEKQKYNRSPTSTPPGFDPRTCSIQRHFNTKYVQWRVENRLDPADDTIFFHKCFAEKHRQNVFNILQEYKEAGIDRCLSEITKFFAVDNIEIFDLLQKFLEYKPKKNQSAQDVFSILYDLKSSCSPNDNDSTLVEACKIQFIN